MTVNKVILLGNIGVDPEPKQLTNGDYVLELSIATSESWNDKNTGEKKTVTEWHKVVFYGKPVDIICKFLKKGDKIYVEGKIKTEKYTDKKTGVEKYATKIIANEFKMLGTKDKQEQQNVTNSNDYSKASNGGLSDFIDDDVPF
jgi:single-strand DNA-binding protein